MRIVAVLCVALLVLVDAKHEEDIVGVLAATEEGIGGACETQGGKCADIGKNACSNNFKKNLCAGASNMRCCVGTLIPVANLSPECIHTVKVGDTLGEIASDAGTTVNTLVLNNVIPNPNLIFPNQKIILCATALLSCTITENGVSFTGSCQSLGQCEDGFGLSLPSPVCKASQTRCCLKVTDSQVVLPDLFNLPTPTNLPAFKAVVTTKYPVGTKVKVYTKNMIQSPNFLINFMQMVRNTKGVAFLEEGVSAEEVQGAVAGLEWIVGKALGDLGGEIAKLAKLAGAGAVVVTAAISNCVVSKVKGNDGNVYAWSFEPRPGFSVETNTKVGVTLRTVEQRMRDTIRVTLMRQAGLFARCTFSCTSGNYKLIESQAHLYLAPYNMALKKMKFFEAKMAAMDQSFAGDTTTDSISPWLRSGHTEFFAVEELQAMAAIQLATLTSGCPCMVKSTFIEID